MTDKTRTMEEKYKQVCKIILNAGGTPVPLNDTLLEIIKRIILEDEVDFIMAFKDKNSQTIDQLKASSGLNEDQIVKITDKLARKGVIFNQPSSKGLKIYRLLPLMNVGVFEYMFMKKLDYTRENREIGRLFSKLFKEQKMEIQESYDKVLSTMDKLPAVDRTVPIRVNKPTGNTTVIQINKSFEPTEEILQTQNVADLIEKFDEIAVGHCFCRQHRDVVEESCKQTDLRECCFTFGKSARFTSTQGFMRMIDKKEALKILLKAEEDGLVHKAYHPNFDVTKDETSVCNCCKCCCINSVVNQKEPIINAAGFLAQVDPDTCIGCGECEDHCYSDAITLTEDSIAAVDETRCIGCGACAHLCPVDAIRLIESRRIVRIALPKQ
ncbi:MAG: 4Fe-4S binding protein [Proteobacteria bacterium]|nr:4Fe-4S binding protein [Pseudomonadota bacterium]MBU1388645.1 4Fe-4S binding protein [Pseudomonadota bacterium]MBU1544886.1 4Fe-4S binding protein [Pseudomonadota bacterium]MBU2429340.1 4Fe-4S binding protein [Pseudomonadota bacterium]MBU2479472.1 4Fe-4S binding protein [Pseudomonadota bacterium]